MDYAKNRTVLLSQNVYLCRTDRAQGAYLCTNYEKISYNVCIRNVKKQLGFGVPIP